MFDTPILAECILLQSTHHLWVVIADHTEDIFKSLVWFDDTKQHLIVTTIANKKFIMKTTSAGLHDLVRDGGRYVFTLYPFEYGRG